MIVRSDFEFVKVHTLGLPMRAMQRQSFRFIPPDSLATSSPFFSSMFKVVSNFSPSSSASSQVRPFNWKVTVHSIARFPPRCKQRFFQGLIQFLCNLMMCYQKRSLSNTRIEYFLKSDLMSTGVVLYCWENQTYCMTLNSQQVLDSYFY